MKEVSPSPQSPHTHTKKNPTTLSLGCVSYLNAKPLIHNIQQIPNTHITYNVPSALLQMLEEKTVDIALCPVIDFLRAKIPLQILNVGGIGSNGNAMTVRLYSKIPPQQIHTVHADTDSHTSVMLLRILLKEVYHRDIQIINFNARKALNQEHQNLPPTCLLIGDKVITHSPNPDLYPIQIDLGQLWKHLTNLPFVFATWMTRKGKQLGQLPQQLDQLRKQNAKKIPAIADQYAQQHGWQPHLAKQYLGHCLQYQITTTQIKAIKLYLKKAATFDTQPHHRPLEIYPQP